MTPKIEWCNWVFDYMDTNKWRVKRDCCDDDQNKWTVYYNHNDKELLVEATAFLQYPSAIYFDTYDSIKKSIEENKQDWLIYFGIKEWK